MAAAHTHAHAHAHAGPDMSDVLLPDSVKPYRYQLTIVTALDDKKFSGRVVAHVTCAKPTSTIRLHALGLNFGAQNVRLIAALKPVEAKAAESYSAPPPAWSDGVSVGVGESAIACTDVKFDEKQQTAALSFASSLQAGAHYRLVIAYSAALNSKLAGFYYSEYKTGEQKRPIGVTQFEPTDARRALPCWDEPSLKATFEVTLIVPARFEAVSNGATVLRRFEAATPAADDAKDGVALTWGEGMQLHRFAESPVMSTYLLAWVVGEFEYVSAVAADPNKTHVRVLTPIGKSALGGFALRVSQGALAFFAAYFHIPYMIPKMDLLAIPDFAAGAMENFGCVTYRETALLIDELHSSAIAKQRVARTVCHEIAHMWFGNLVTMNWWQALWLNEGFARFMEFQAVNHLFPDWHIFDSFVDEVFGMALGLDSLANSHPIEVDVHHPSEINEIFDMISYAKGASVLRMLHDYIGADSFKAGLRIYLNRHKWANAKTHDLWAALSEASGVKVAELMDTWLYRTGYPVLSITEQAPAASGARRFRITQTRFLADGSKEEPLTEATAKDAKGRVINRNVWRVPIGVDAIGADGNRIAVPTLVLDAETKDFELPAAVGAGAAVKFNRNQSGFYRVLYTAPLLEPALKALKSWSAADRLGIQGDVFAAAKAGALPITTTLEVAGAFNGESEYCVVSNLGANLIATAKVHGDAPYFGLLQRFIRDSFDALYLALGWNPSPAEDHITGLKRATVLGVMQFAGDERVISEAKKRFAAFVVDPTANAIRADLRSLVYVTAVKHDDDDSGDGGDAKATAVTAFDTVVKMLVDPNVSAEERQRLLDAIGRARNPKRVEQAVALAFGDKVRTQDVPWIFGSIGASSAVGRTAAWAYLQHNWKAIAARFQETGFLIPRIVSAAISGWADAKKADEIAAFFRANPCPEADRVIKQNLESIRANAARLVRETQPLANYLSAKYPGAGAGGAAKHA